MNTGENSPDNPFTVAKLEVRVAQLEADIDNMNKAYSAGLLREKKLEAENEALQHTVDWIWQEIYEADEPVLSVSSVEKLRRLGNLQKEK